MWRTNLVLFCSVLASYSYPDPPSNDTIQLTSDELLLHIQPPVRRCYIQYAAAAKHIAQFAPSILASSWEDFQKLPNEKKNICICETWLPQKKPSQLYINIEKSVLCLENELSEECDSFKDTCLLNFWLGDPAENTNPSIYKSSAILKCTADSSTDPKIAPKYLVKVEKIDEYDVGRRCHVEAIAHLLNYKIELYRVGSQYFWQIPIFSREFFMERHLCDSRIFQSRVAMRIRYKCSAEIPSLLLHEKPVPRTLATVLPSSLHESNECYMQQGPPWAGVMLRNFADPFALDAGMCLCELQVGILDQIESSNKIQSGGGSCKNRKTYVCAKRGTDQCVYKISLDYEDDVDFWCDSVDGNDLNDGPPNLGNQYFPNYVAKVHDVSMRTSDLIDKFTDGRQIRFCGNDAYPQWSQREGLDVTELIKEQHEVWASYINDKIQYRRPNSNIHLHTIFNVKNYIDTWCPLVYDHEFRAREFGEGYKDDMAKFELMVKIVCVHQKPMDLGDQ